MSRMRRWLLLVPVAVGATADAARADSIWDRRDPKYAFLFQDNRARNVGDVLVIQIGENTVANENERRSLDKSNDASGNVQFAGSSSANAGAGQTGAASFNLTNAFRRRFNGTAQLTAGRQFTDRMAVTVVDIMPNGNLVIEGYRSRVVAGEERVLRLTGVVRPQDIGFGNVVGSPNVANFKISYLGRGPASRSLNQNYFGRLGNLLWPW